ncbi:hypothetical protein D3C79_49080 [compost metagenome]
MIRTCPKRAAAWRERELWKADLELRAYNKPGFTYQDAVGLLRDTLQQLSYLPVHDVAHGTFVRLADQYRHVCNALYISGGYQQKDHLEAVDVIWSYDNGNVTEEKTLWIPCGIKMQHRRELELKAAGTTELLRMGIHPQMTTTLEIVLV